MQRRGHAVRYPPGVGGVTGEFYNHRLEDGHVDSKLLHRSLVSDRKISGVHMTREPKFEPHKITKPIQLLAAWLAGLVAVNGLFLFAAAKISHPPLIPYILTVAAIVNVPVFLLAVYRLQTKYRREIQEDHYYSKYLGSLTGNTPIEPIPNTLVTWTSAEEGAASSEDQSRSKHRAILQHRWDAKIAVNRFRSDLLEILAVLKDNGIPFSEAFGSETNEAPPYFQIAVGYNVAVVEIKLTVLAFGHYREGRISLIAPHEEPNELSDTILIGSYGRPSGPRLVDAYEVLDKGLMPDSEFRSYLSQGTDSSY